jgi:CRP/FNR family transcriptional regulator, cyclic AMP receptor protein
MEKKHSTPLYRIWGPEKVLYGPYELPILASWVRQNRLKPESWVFCDHRDLWTKAGALEELKPLFDKSHARPGHMASALKGGVNPDVMLRVKVLSGLKEDQLQSFVRYMEILTLDALATAVKEGDRGDALFLILEGEVRVRVVRDGTESILATLKAGEFFGEVSLLDEGPRSADVVANERSTLLKISTASFAKLRHEAPALAEPFLHALSQILVGRLRVLNKRYVDSLLMLQTLAAPAPLRTGRRGASTAAW